jgi:hypothetical protein
MSFLNACSWNCWATLVFCAPTGGQESFFLPPWILSPFPQLWFCLPSSTTLKKGLVLGISRNLSATDLHVAQITNSPFFTFLALQHASMSHRPYLWLHCSFDLKSLMGNISSTTQSNKLKKQQANWRIQQEESGTPLKKPFITRSRKPFCDQVVWQLTS